MNKLKKAIIAIVLLLVGGGGSYVAIDNFGATAFDDRTTISLLGTSSNFVSLPNAMVFGDATTTDAGGSVADGGFILQQLVTTGGIRRINLNIGMIGGTVTSTLYIRQMGSFNGIDYFNLATTSAILGPTTTPSSIIPRGTTVEAGLSSTSISFPFEIDGYRFTRFIMYGDNLSTDPDDGVQAWITATKVRDKE